jgi:hypothetical protein
MSNINLQNIIKIKNEIESLLVEIKKKEENILEHIQTNTYNIILYKTFLENIIDEYHNVCTVIYK